MKKGSSGSKRPFAAQNGSAEDHVSKQQKLKPGEALAVKESAAKKKPVVKKEPVVKDDTVDPVAKDKPVAKNDPLAKDKPVAKDDPLAKDKPVVKDDPVAKDKPVVKDEPTVKDETKTAPSIPVIDKLRRFCFIGSTDAPVYAKLTLDHLVDKNYVALKDLCSQVGQSELEECLSSVLGSGPNADHLPRAEEPLLILAVYLSTRDDFDQRKLMRDKFVDLIASDKELLLFVQLVKRLQRQLDRKTPISRTVRKAVLAWYSKQSLERLLHYWSVGSGGSWSGHRDILHLCHFQDEDYPPDKKAALKLLSSPPAELVMWPSSLSPLTAFRPIIDGVNRLRLMQDPAEALHILKKLSLTWEHVPLQLLQDSRLLTFLIPRLNYNQMLQSWINLSRQHRHMCPLEIELKDEERLKTGNVSPVRFLIENIRVQKQRRPVRGQVHVKSTFLRDLYEKSFGMNKALGRRLHITLNLEQCYLGKNLTGPCRSLTYVDALMALAFGYFRSDPKVTVQFWENRNGSLKTLPWTKQMSVAEAKACLENQKVVKIKQTLTDILERALADEKNTYDVFLALLPGAGRGNSRHSSQKLAALMDEYREKRSSNAKFIVVSLRQHHRSMHYGVERNENLLELCSLDEHTPRLINAFVRKKFY